MEFQVFAILLGILVWLLGMGVAAYILAKWPPSGGGGDEPIFIILWPAFLVLVLAFSPIFIGYLLMVMFFGSPKERD